MGSLELELGRLLVGAGTVVGGGSVRLLVGLAGAVPNGTTRPLASTTVYPPAQRNAAATVAPAVPPSDPR
jgi:hypothetical protein